MALVFGVAVLAGGLLWGYTRAQSVHFDAWKKSSGRPIPALPTEPVYPSGALLSSRSDIQALKDRDTRAGRSPAFVPGSQVDPKLKAFVDRAFADPKIAAAELSLREHFPDHLPVNRWIRAAMTLGTLYSDTEISPETFESIGKVYAQVLGGEESSVASLQAGLRSLPASDAAFRIQAFHMLSDIGLKDPAQREAVKNVLLTEAARAGNRPEGALAFTSLLRVNPTKEWYREVARAYEKLHPGSDLSDFVSLNVANL